MAPRYQSVAVIGAGPSGISAVKALQEENTFQNIRLFERRGHIGGIWQYDEIPDLFPSQESSSSEQDLEIPSRLPLLKSPSPEDVTSRTGIYDGLDSNVGAKVMAFTHTPFPEINSASSSRHLGKSNPTRPFRVVRKYLEDIFQDYLHLASLNTTVEKVEKRDGKWTLALRQSGHGDGNTPKDYWWEEQFDAVIVASGHYSVPFVPFVKGLSAAFARHPTIFEHSKAFRRADDYVDKRVVVVGGSVSAADLVADLHAIVKGPLELSQRGKNEALQSAWDLPNVNARPTIKEIQATEEGINVVFSDNSLLEGVDKIIFATGYKLSYPFLVPNPVTPNNRVAGFYQHIFKIGDPSLALVGQVRAAISFRAYEYQAVAVARYFAGRNAASLPTPQEQDLWEVQRLQYKGHTALFHEIKPDFKEYFDFLTELAGPPAPGTGGYSLPPWEDRWAEQGFEILQRKDKYWKSLRRAADGLGAVTAKL
ncbi:Flavin monooxygenase FMO [Penicillium expansum]|uniref:Flavin monooxygenase FMO n=1 Tax=Penicillium expansum TaxID=27334 RepID=A0A0A2JR45_PENEN|nr:Flavin monooxygenase FMO [Penicillium expansum]KGO47835.1 Flavin monooxygenase FMO [Penicillium expansum]KGO50727.1 Flavin monooxygenase FMO [Penicillium expansum]KGO57912.1 Flavin monooxygenase FMO [Penicillium expansum]